ncbi:MAG: MOSC domain-containing protein [Actinobacteria bacterium]|nr:MOSC domain-containing protein [Actinomycetota bacterium]
MSLSLASIHVYPVKSLGGFSVAHARLTDRGLEHDRRWMLVDEHGRFLSQRELPQMACLHTAPMADGFRVTDLRDGGTLDLPWTLTNGGTRTAAVWDDVVQVMTAAEAYGTWFSERLGTAVALVFMPDTSERPTDTRYATATTSLSDAFPYLIVSQASLHDLNERIGRALRVPMDRFRPSLVIAGGTPFQEDGWERITIGAAYFDLVKPCARCVITTTDQHTGQRGKEPLRTLANFRKRAGGGPVKIDFGMNAIGSTSGMVEVGDVVQRFI